VLAQTGRLELRDEGGDAPALAVARCREDLLKNPVDRRRLPRLGAAEYAAKYLT